LHREKLENADHEGHYWNLSSIRGSFMIPSPVSPSDLYAATLPAMEYERFFARAPRVCGGQLVIAETRVPVRSVLASLAEGHGPETIRAAFPSVSLDAVRALIAFAAVLDIPPLPRLPVLA
jgi:uncharacterized protein (DUF433 family)